MAAIEGLVSATAATPTFLGGNSLWRKFRIRSRCLGCDFFAAAGTYHAVPLKVVVKTVPKKIDLGKLDVGASQDSSTEFECNYLKVWVDGEEKIEIDKFNFICVIDGEDYLAEVRQNLGL